MKKAFSLYEVILSVVIFSSLLFILSRFTEVNLHLSDLYKLNKEKIIKTLNERNATTFSKNSYFNGDFNVPIFSGIVDINKSSGNLVYLVASKLTLLKNPIKVRFKNSDKIYNATIISDAFLELNQTFVIEKEILIMDKI